MLKDYPKTIVTADGTSVLLRPVVQSDEEGLRKFFSSIPEEEQWFLRENLVDPARLHEWLEKLDYNRILPIIAVREDNGEIIGNVRLYCSPVQCIRHVAHLRIMVLPAYRHLKVGSWLLLDCIKAAMDLGIEKLIAELIEGLEEPAINAARKFNFRQEVVLPDYVKDRKGKKHNLIIMVKNLHRGWSDF